MIELRGISFSYADTPVLTGIDLRIDDGELVLLSGPTGAGKSTLLGVVTGLVPRFSGGRLAGDVLLDGASIVRTPPRERADWVGYVGQDPAAGFVTDTVEEELAYGMEQLGLPAETMRRRVEETLDLLGIAELRDRDLRTLSGGQQQRVAIGSVLTMHPRLLVLDEPTSALDPTAAEDVLATLTRLVHDVGVSVLLAEHRLERVVPFADRMCLLRGDGTLQVGEPADVLATSPVVPPIVELGRTAGWQPLPLTVRDARRLARELTIAPPAHVDEPTGIAPALTARGVTVVHGRTAAVNGLDLVLGQGRVTALMGRNGSGKSSLLWALQGSGSRRSGSVLVGDVDPGRPRRDRPPGAGGPAPADRRRPPLSRDGRRGVCSGRRRHPGAPGPAGAGHCRRYSSARPLGGAAARARAGPGAGGPAACSSCSTSRPRPRLLRQGRAGDHPARPRRRGRAVLVATHDVEFVGAGGRRRGGARRRRGGAARDPTRRVVAESPAFAPRYQGARPALAAGRRGRRRMGAS